MPPTRYTPDELRRGAELISDPDNQPDVIEKRYRMGEITLKEKLEAQSAYGKIQRELSIHQEGMEAQAKGEAISALGKHGAGEIKYYVQNVVKGYQGAWNAYQKGDSGKAVLRSMMASLETVKALDLPGDIVERWALEGGASPGLAKIANWAVWLPVNFVGLTTLAKPATATGGAVIRGFRGVKEIIKDEKAFLSDPVAYVTKQARNIDGAVVKQATETAQAGAEGAAKAAAKPKMQAVQPNEIGGMAPVPNEALGVIKSPQDLEKLTIEEILKYYEGRATGMVRHGVTHEQTAKAASKEPMSIVDLVKRGADEPVSATEIEQIGRVHDQVSKGFETAFEEAFKHADDLGNGVRPDLMVALKTHLLAMEVTNPAFLSARGQAGRGLEYMKTQQELVGRSLTWDTTLKSLSANVLHEGNDRAVSDMVQKLGLLSKENRAKFITEAGKGEHKSTILHSLFKNLLFLSPSTHIVNTGGSVANSMGKVGVDYLSAFTIGGPTLREVNAEVAGVLNAGMHLPRIWRQAVERSGHRLEKYGLEGAEDVLAKYGTGRAMAIEDELVGGVLEAGLVQGEAMKRVIASGIKDKAAQKTAIDAMISDPVQLDDMIKAVAPDVDDTMFHAPLSKATEKFAEWVRNSPFDYYMPIVKFPINELKMARDWTPGLQVLSKKFADEIAAGGDRAARANTRMALSWMFSNTIWAGTKAGLITGGGPQNPEARAIWLKNNTPYSINGYSYRWAAGFVEVMGAAADMAEMSNQVDPDSAQDMGAALSLTMMRMLENNWALRVMEGVTEVMSDTKRLVISKGGQKESEAAAEAEPMTVAQRRLDEALLSAAKVVGAPIATVVGGGTVGGKLRENLDPEVKDIRTYADFFMSKIPGWSKDIRPKQNWSGKPELTPPTIGSRWLNFVLPAVRPKTGDEDPVAAWMTKHEITGDDDWKSNNSTQLTGDESHDWKHIAFNQAEDFNGRTWQQAIEDMENDPEFHGKTRAQKQQQFNRTYTRFRDRGWEGLKNVKPEIAAREQMVKDLKREAKGKTPYEAFGLQPETDQPTPTQHEVEYVPVPMAEEVQPTLQ